MINKLDNPDILNCIANLSSDEVFTPPSIANQILDNLPNEISTSSILSGSDLAILASLGDIPSKTDFLEREGKNIAEKHTLAKKYLSQGNVNYAWQVLL